ncbi:MAG: hypothetical protein F6K03_09705 [Kamptonema sp. SIO4C4]|nr:hypothetical protein [Kamptonema sp. SIO4C4]
MDIVAISSLLIPWLPILLKKAGESAVSSAAGQMGKDTWQQAQAIWAKLHPKIEAEAGAKVAAEELAKNPDDPTWKAPFEQKLTEILENDPELKAAIAAILQETEDNPADTSIKQQIGTVTKGQAVANMKDSTAINVGGDVSGGINAT